MRTTASELIRDLTATRDATLGFFALPAEQLDRRYGPDKWSVRWLLHHLADSETVLYERVRRVISEPAQTLAVFEQDAWAERLDYSRVPLRLSRAIYESVRAGHIHYAERFYESHGHLTFIHSVMGPRTLKEEFDKVADHNAHHLSQIRLALSSARRV